MNVGNFSNTNCRASNFYNFRPIY